MPNRVLNLKLEKIIASSSRQKILLTLSKVKKTHITKLVRMVNSNYNDVNRNLIILEKEGIIKMHMLGHVRIIELRRENPKAQALLEALDTLQRSCFKSFGSEMSRKEI